MIDGEREQRDDRDDRDEMDESVAREDRDVYMREFERGEGKDREKK